jgi:hypothetical protein
MTVFETNKKEKSILDCFTYNLSTFFYDEYEEIDSVETPATFMIVYQKKLPWKELGIFDTVQFRIFFDKETITGSNPVNVRFISKIEEPTALKSIVNKVYSIYGADDSQIGEWNPEDEKKLEEDAFRRVWTIEKGESFVSIENTKADGISLNILFFNNMIKQSANEPDIK